MANIRLHILSPEGPLVEREVSLVTLPGMLAPFTVLPGHAPLATALLSGDIRYVAEGREERFRIREGFVEVKDNEVSACVDI